MEKMPGRENSQLPDGMGGGPMGLGDPDDRYLRKVEKEIIIPSKMKKMAKSKCPSEIKDFSDCGKDQGLLLPFFCRKEATVMKECLAKWYKDKDFMAEVTEEYLKERSEYRRTGISKKQGRKGSSTF